MAWTYPDGDTDFNPLVVRDVIYTRARGNTLVAVDAATGEERWASPEIKAFAMRGMNYWESADGKDRRLLLSTLNMLRAFDAKHRPAHSRASARTAWSICVKGSIAIRRPSSSRADCPGKCSST